MEIPKLEYPDHLNKPDLSPQELSGLNAENRALAEGWRVMSRKIEWSIEQTITNRDILIQQEKRQGEQDKILDTWKRVYWLITVIGGSIVIVLAMLRFLGYGK